MRFHRCMSELRCSGRLVLAERNLKMVYDVEYAIDRKRRHKRRDDHDVLVCEVVRIPQRKKPDAVGHRRRIITEAAADSGPAQVGEVKQYRHPDEAEDRKRT